MSAAPGERPTSDEWHCDVLVVGSGASGLVAAIAAKHHGLDVCVVEKQPQIGGCSAYSHGMLWIPGNPDRSAALHPTGAPP
jgi:succinate dehydrogenase/fumarate reductase flavoprotein subunit